MVLMTFSPELIALGRYLAGEFDNQQQAIADPVWYVHLCLWQRPVPLFVEDSITLFAEQSNILNPELPYRQRLLRLLASDTSPTSVLVQYYMIKEPASVRGAGSNPALLKKLTPDQIELLPGCTLNVTQRLLNANSYYFSTSPSTGDRCCFTYQGETYQVSLGFEASPDEFRSYDKGIDPNTGKAIWGALLGPYIFTKRQDLAAELPI